MRTASHGAVYVWAANLLSDDVAIGHRRRVIRELSKFRGRNVNELPTAVRKSFKDTCRRYDMVGIAAHNGMLPYGVIVQEWGDSIIKTHEVCQPFIRQVRKERGDQFWDNYTNLYLEAKKIWKYSAS
jgi:hypothetical protein